MNTTDRTIYLRSIIKLYINSCFLLEKDVIEDELRSPSFLKPLQDVSVKENDCCELRCKVSGNPLPVIQWYRNDVCVESHPFYEITYNNGDAKLVIKNASREDCATFKCCAVNSLGTLTSSCNVMVLSELKHVQLLGGLRA